MLKTIVAVVAGYAVFAVSAVLLFQLSGVDPHAHSSTAFRVFGILYGAAFALAAGYLSAALARPHGNRAAAVVAAIVALAGAWSLLARPGDGAVWTQVASIVLFAPLVLLGARLRKDR